MPLDPDAQGVLDLFASLNAPELSDLTPDGTQRRARSSIFTVATGSLAISTAMTKPAASCALVPAKRSFRSTIG